MDALMQLIAQYGLWLVFASVLLDQGGVPLPAYPTLIVASATVDPTVINLGAILLVAVRQRCWPMRCGTAPAVALAGP